MKLRKIKRLRYKQLMSTEVIDFNMDNETMAKVRELFEASGCRVFSLWFNGLIREAMSTYLDNPDQVVELLKERA